MNAICIIHPYKYLGTWVFDDPGVGLLKEPFVSGADTIIDRLSAGIPAAEAGFTLLFSSNPFPGSSFQLEWRREDCGGHWYYNPDSDLEGWLCPAMFKYFEEAPGKIYLQFKSGK